MQHMKRDQKSQMELSVDFVQVIILKPQNAKKFNQK